MDQVSLRNYLGELLLQARLSAGHSKQKLAEQAGVSVSAVRLCETGRGRISTFQALVATMGFEFRWPGYDPGLSLGENLRARRRKIGHSQRAIAATIRVSKNTIIAMEATSRGRVDTLQLLLGTLQVWPRLKGTSVDHEQSEYRQLRLIPQPNGAEADRVYTPRDLAKLIVGHFPLQGTVLDPCRGTGAFFDQLPVDQVQPEWCEIEDGRDFFDWHRPVDWVLTNPPWSQFRIFLKHAMTVAENVVFLATLNHFSTRARLGDIRIAEFGLREIVLFPTPKENWPSSGFQVAAIHLQRGWTGSCKINDQYLAGV